MKGFKLALMSATIAATGIATVAHAQTSIPAPNTNDGDAALHGAGASSIQNILVRSLNCVGVNNQLGASGGANGTFSTISAGLYSPTTPLANDPIFNCATDNLQPNFNAKYVATGSGFGRQIWRLYSAQFSPTTSGVHNPFNELSGQNAWSHVQYAFSDTIISPSDVNTYNTNANSATNQAGPAVQFPMYLLPVAVVYNPVYGTNASNQPMTLNVVQPQSINGVVAGGLRMSRATMCKVFNGEITNLNDAAFLADNNNNSLRDFTNDVNFRWLNDGAPIRLVGRLDRSGTTDVFTRHLAAVCTGVATSNKFTQNAESLPYNASSGVNLSNVRADTGYATGNNNGNNYPNAGSTNSVSGDYFNGTAIVYNGSGPSSAPTGAVGSGLFITADGSGRVRDAINLAPDYQLRQVRTNGKIGYIGADFVTNAVTSNGLFAAALQVGGTGTSYAMPSALNAVRAFGTGATALVPPQSDASGNFVLNGDTRTARLAAGGTGPATRDNPIAWTDVLYSSTNNNLAAPVEGYPITGTTQFFGYTCYLTNNRFNLVEFLGANFGLIVKDSTNANFGRNTFRGTASTQLGIVAQSNLAIMPQSWQTAISETFLTRSTQTSSGQALSTYGNGGNGLWIQSKSVVAPADFNNIVQANDAVSNPSCTANVGA